MSRVKGTDKFKVGDVFQSLLCGEFVVTSYDGVKSVGIRFLDSDFEMKTSYSQVITGSVKDPMKKSVCGVGFIGSGSYKASSMNRKPYLVWRSMLHRCYMMSINHPSYWDCSVCDEWHNFQIFAEWFEANYHDGLELDKDTLVDGNKVYSPSTCVFISKKDNLSANSKPVTLMNGISGDIHSFKSVTEAASKIGVSAAVISRLCNGPKDKCTTSGWFFCRF